MATSTHYLKGIAKWAKVHRPDEKYGKHSIDLGMTKEQLSAYEKIGLKNKPKEADGLHWVTFRRDPTGMVWVNRVQTIAGKPSVVDSNNNTTDVTIGNGSEVTIELQVYDYDNKFGKGKGSRLEKVKIDKLVEFKPEAKEDGIQHPW